VNALARIPLITATVAEPMTHADWLEQYKLGAFDTDDGSPVQRECDGCPFHYDLDQLFDSGCGYYCEDCMRADGDPTDGETLADQV